MKSNPFLSNQNIFSKAPTRKATIPDCSPIGSSYTAGSSYQTPSSNYGLSQQYSMAAPSRPNQNFNLSSLMNTGYSDQPNYSDSYGTQQVAYYQAPKQDRMSVYQQQQPPMYSNGYSRASEMSMGEPILNRQRSITNNYSTQPDFQTMMTFDRTLQQPQMKMPEVKSPIFEQSRDFPDMSMLTACLSNNQNMEEICKLIGLSAPAIQVPVQPTKYNPPPPPQYNYQSALTPSIQTHQQNYSNVQPNKQENMKISSSSSRQQFKQESHLEVRQAPQAVPSFKKQQNWQEFTAPRLSKKSSMVDVIQSPLKFQSDQQEEFDFNENRDEEVQVQYNSPFSKKVSRVLTSKQNQLNQPFRIEAFVLETGDIKSIKDSLQRQITQNTVRNGVKVFLTVSEQINARRYIPK